MLVELSIRDLALIEAAELSFGPGLNVITGETGAGKSLVVGALDLVLGGRPRAGGGGLVRAGASEARLEARFELEPKSPRGLAVSAFLASELEDFAGEFAKTGELILGRNLTAEGRTRARVNQRPVPLKALRGLAGILLELHGQNDHQRLIESAEQRDLLDAYGGHARALATYGAKREVALEAAAALARFHTARDERRDRIDLLRFQVGELRDARIEAGEAERLRAERELLRHGEELASELGGVASALSESDSALLDRLRFMEQRVEAWRGRVPGLDEAADSLREAVVFTEEAAAALVSFTGGIEVDPLRLEETEERLAELERLFGKFDRDEAGLVELLGSLQDELARLEEEESSSEQLEVAAEAAAAVLAKAAKALTRARTKAKKPLAAKVEAALGGLGLAAARFEVELEPLQADGAEVSDLTAFGPLGAESVHFLLAANPGEPAAPLARVASGGEVARIMLALRGVLSAAEAGRTLIFDEIDSGVGGRLGPAVAKRLRELGEVHQVLCVTHLPSIAASAHLHLKVQKEVRGGRTLTVFEVLSGEARLFELAEMIAGGGDEDTARAEAARLLSTAS
jgi:DNA repair protein RecN (Recombination protein N)